MGTERLYYSDSFLRRFQAQVTAVRQIPAGGGVDRYEVALDRTAFYPTSGGQPFDTGHLRVPRESGEWLNLAVDSVAEDEHGEIWHTLHQPLSPGAAVEGEIAWGRRLDHMQQHTGQHLLSALFLSELQAPTLSFHLGPATSNIDLACPSLTGEELEGVELAANRIIAEDRPVTARAVPRPEAEALLAAGKLRKLPEREGAIRLIEIESCDLNACGGTHARTTGQIGGLWLRATEKVSRGVRVHFVCGLRAVRAGRDDAAALGQAMGALSVGAADLGAAIARLQAEAKAAGKDRLRLREALARAEGVQMAAAAELNHGVRIVEAACAEHDRDYVRLLASRTANAAPRTVAILSSGEPQGARVALARSRDLDFDCGAMMKQALAERNLRGGGSSDLAQGELQGSAAAELRAALAARVRALLA
ncbi:MAG: alanyl-tRNA editing protein [Terriglobales bacterium]